MLRGMIPPMVGYVLVALGGGVVGLVCGVLLRGSRRGQPSDPAIGGSAGKPKKSRISEKTAERVTAFGEELSACDFDPAAAEATPEMLTDYQIALDAYERAGDAEKEPEAASALWEGRAALTRLAARRAGRPVPIDALPNPVRNPGGITLEHAGERHVMTGHGSGEAEVMIDHPDPGRLCVAELRLPAKNSIWMKAAVRTETDSRGLGELFEVDGPYRGRRLLPAAATHLLVTTFAALRWSVRVSPLSSGVPLGTGWRGESDEVLRHDGGPAVVTVTAQTRGYWQARFVCACGEEVDTCQCAVSALVGDAPTAAGAAEDGRDQLVLPRAGYLVLTTSSGPVVWQVDVAPADSWGAVAPAAAEPQDATEGQVLAGRGIGLAVPIDRPEPGRLAIAEIDVPNRTELRIETTRNAGGDLEKVDELVDGSKPHHGRHLLTTEATHLRVLATELAPWSVQVSPLSAAIPLGAEWRGTGSEVLSWNGGPAELTVRADTQYYCWVDFVCACMVGGDTCRCEKPKWPAGVDGWRTNASGVGLKNVTMVLPRPGCLRLRVNGTPVHWQLRTRLIPEAADPA